jgi:hypothetical protein
MSDAMTVSHSPNSWAGGPLEEIRTIRTGRDWVLHTADSIQALLEQYEQRGPELADELAADEPETAALLERILAVYGDPPSR